MNGLTCCILMITPFTTVKCMNWSLARKSLSSFYNAVGCKGIQHESVHREGAVIVFSLDVAERYLHFLFIKAKKRIEMICLTEIRFYFLFFDM